MRYRISLLLMLGLVLTSSNEALGQVITTNPATADGATDREFDTLVVRDDGAGGLNIFVTTNIGSAIEANDLTAVVSLPAGFDPATDTASVTSLRPSDFDDVDFAPVVSPDGQTVLSIDSSFRVGDDENNSIFTLDISGALPATPQQLLASANNLPMGVTAVGNGTLFSPDGSTVFFLGEDGGSNGDDIVFSAPLAGGSAPVAITPAVSNINGGAYTLTGDGQRLFFASNDGVAELFSVPVDGTAVTTEVVLPNLPAHDFDFAGQVKLTPNGQNLLFVADLNTSGKNELFSVPLNADGTAAGAPVRVSDDLAFGGDVFAFDVSPDGSTVVYTASPAGAETVEVFSTQLATPGSGNSVRISPRIAIETNTELSVSDDANNDLSFSPDGSQVFFLGDIVTNSVNDLVVVDGSSTDAEGASITGFVFNNAAGDGDFFNEANYADPVTGLELSDANQSLTTNSDIDVPLILDGDAVTAAGQIQIDNGTLILTPGSSLNVTDTMAGNDGLDLQTDGALHLDNATLIVDDLFTSEDFDLLVENNSTITVASDASNGDFDLEPGTEGTFINSTVNVAVDFRIDDGDGGDDLGDFVDVVFLNSTINVGDDVEFQANVASLAGSTFNVDDSVFVENMADEVEGGVFNVDDSLVVAVPATIDGSTFNLTGVADAESTVSIVNGSAVTINDSTITVTGEGDLETVGEDDGVLIQGVPTPNVDDAAVVTLTGTTSLTIDSIGEGVDLVLEDSSRVTFGTIDANGVVDPDGTPDSGDEFFNIGPIFDPDGVADSGDEVLSLITLQSLDAVLSTTGVAEIDISELIIDGRTGRSFAEDPAAFVALGPGGVALTDLTLTPIAELRLFDPNAPADGDYNDDGVVNAADFVVFRDGAALGGTFAEFVANFDSAATAGVDSLTAVPEPSTVLLLPIFGLAAAIGRRRLPAGS